MPTSPERKPAPPGYLWLDEAADRLRLSPQTLYNYRHLGIGPESEKYRRRVVYKIETLDAWMQDELGPKATSERDSRPPEPRLARAA